ncbi:MAG: DUF1786 family protein, partial [Candidatus Heimdallarchaeota archaeon]
YLPRHKAIAKSALAFFNHLTYDDIFVMDSSPAVILGAVDYRKIRQLAVNVGNGHTLAVIFKEKLVEAIYEIHTGGIKLERFTEDLHRLARGELSHEEALRSGGHGVFIRDQIKLEDSEIEDLFPMTVIGPNRHMIKSLNVKFVNPAGSMMMAGPIGLLRAYHELNDLEFIVSLY